MFMFTFQTLWLKFSICKTELFVRPLLGVDTVINTSKLFHLMFFMASNVFKDLISNLFFRTTAWIRVTLPHQQASNQKEPQKHGFSFKKDLCFTRVKIILDDRNDRFVIKICLPIHLFQRNIQKGCFLKFLVALIIFIYFIFDEGSNIYLPYFVGNIRFSLNHIFAHDFTPPQV